LKAILAVIILPGTIIIIVPAVLLIISGEDCNKIQLNIWGLLQYIIAIYIIVHCATLFKSVAQCTISPFSFTPPKALIVSGFYKYSRNPIFFAMLIAVLAVAIMFNSIIIYIYTLFLYVIFQYRINKEEQWLQKEFPKDWETYKENTPRWL